MRCYSSSTKRIKLHMQVQEEQNMPQNNINDQERANNIETVKIQNTCYSCSKSQLAKPECQKTAVRHQAHKIRAPQVSSEQLSVAWTSSVSASELNLTSVSLVTITPTTTLLMNFFFFSRF